MSSPECGITLVVLGYSGLDDFDVIPTMTTLLPDLHRLIWIAHADERTTRATYAASPIPDALCQAIAVHHTPVELLRGRTQRIVEHLFRTPTTRPSAHTTPVQLGDYLTLSPGQQAFVLARLSEHLGMLKKARRYYRQGLAAFTADGNRTETARVTRIVANVEFQLGNTRTALELNQRAVAMHQCLSIPQQLALDLTDRSRMLTRVGDTTGALHAAKRARRLSIGDTSAHIPALLREAQVNRGLGRIARAVTLVSSALHHARMGRKRDLAGRCLTELSQSASNHRR